MPKELADRIGAHLAAAERLLGDDPEAAYRQAQAAARRGARIAAVREICGIAAYAAGHWTEAARELRAARRMSGSDALLPMIADCERGLGRPERALALAASTEAARLEDDQRIEMLIVASGARRDLGQADAAVLMLQVPELRVRSRAAWQLRLRYAYADALVAAGRTDDAAEWFERVASADRDGETDAAGRLAALRGDEPPADPGEVDDPDGIVDLDEDA